MNAEQLKERMRRYAESQGFQLNPDEKIVGFVIQGLLRNEEKFSYRYCPCRAITGDIGEPPARRWRMWAARSRSVPSLSR